MAARKSLPKTTKLEAVRSRIDAVDEQIHRLINERAKLAQLVGISKSRDGHTVDFYRPEREAQVLRRARERNRGPLRDEEVVRLFREIMSACLAQQEPLKVAYLGPEATFSQTAVLTHFGHSVRALPLGSIDEVFHEVESAAADFGVVPIENSTEGTINHTLDRLVGSPLKVCGEVELRIHHYLMGNMNALGRIVRVCSHPQSLAQCRAWLQEHRTTLLVSVSDTDAPGALHRLLEPLAKHRVSMTRIESRPSHRRKWDYIFFIDIDGHAEEPHVRRALEALKRRSSLFRVLGSYPRAVL